MKKVLALVLCVAFLFTLSVTALAKEKSATAKTQYEIIMRKGIGVSGVTENDSTTLINEGDSIVAKFDPSYGTFNNWTIYKRGTDGKTVPAVEGVDYILEDGTLLTSEQIKVQAKADLTICANYNGEKTDPGAASKKGTSDPTGDMSVAYVVVMLAAAAIVFGAKKVYSK
ncbi:MAG: hypothetical protein IKF53_00675 [Clostridia bacterium]|nr:hypothetical protein [Clostridia bacterium]